MGEVQSYTTQGEGNYSSLSMFIRTDNVQITHKVEKQKAVDILINLGGLQKSIAGVFLGITLLVSKKFFENVILGSLFLVKKRSLKEREDLANVNKFDDDEESSKFTEEISKI
jgi:hypothetical protein